VVVRGLIVTMPEGGSLIGDWKIDDKTYTTTQQTEFDQTAALFAPGVCVKVQLQPETTTVLELDSEPAGDCNGSGDDNGDDNGGAGRGELYAKLVTFPTGLIGDWVIGSLTFKADATTEFNQENGQFATGEFVMVEFVVLQDNSMLAKEIKTVAVAHDDDENDDGPGHGHGHGRDDIEHQAVAFGVVDSLPDGSGEGVWQIGGITYTVTISTELEARHGAIKANRNVRVKYWLEEFGNRVAKEIKSMPPAAGGNPQGELKLVGFVKTKPASGFVGNWTVAGVDLIADASSKFNEEDGLIDVGTFVEVKYRKESSSRIIDEMEARVMPGGGDDNHIGEVEQMDDSVAAASTAITAATASWLIGGRNYVVTDATMVGNIATGDTVLVNSYTDASGAQLATRISDVTLDNFLFMPAASR